VLLPSLTASLPELQFVVLSSVIPPAHVAQLCRALGIMRPIRLFLKCDSGWNDAAKAAHVEALQQAVAAAVAAAGVPPHVTIEWDDLCC
jgi:hypothetical protein